MLIINDYNYPAGGRGIQPMGKKDSGIDKDLLAFVSGLDENEEKVSSKKPKINKFTSTFKDDAAKVSVAELTGALDDEMGFANLKKRIENVVEAETKGFSTGGKVEIVAAPLATHQQVKLERQAAYELSSKEISKWIPVIRANRASKHLVLPAKEPILPPVMSEGSSGFFEPKTDFEKKFDQILKDNKMNNEEGIITSEQMEMNKLTPEEIEKRYAELAKKRALLFYKEKKNKQQSKIKSKTFRKHVKMEREKKIRKQIEESGETLTMEELREERLKAEMERIKERMTLKTRKASKWAHEMMQHRKLESGSREEVMQQVRDKDRLRQEIFGKASQFEDLSESELSANDNAEDEHFGSADEGESEVEGGFEVEKKSKKLILKDIADSDEDEDEDEEVDTDDENIEKDEGSDSMDEIFEEPNQIKDIPTVGRRKFEPINPVNKEELEVEIRSSSKTKAKVAEPKRKRAETKDISNLFVAEDESSITLDDKTKSQLEVIKKAFASDNVFSQFEAMKEAEIEADKPKDIDLTLPGWGSWGGVGIAPQKGKVILKSTNGIDPKRRKDAGLKHVIIHEKQNKKVAKLMVEKVPFPFKNREEYEASLIKPIGKEWNSATSYNKKIKPRVQLKVGSIIEPIKFTKRDYRI